MLFSSVICVFTFCFWKLIKVNSTLCLRNPLKFFCAAYLMAAEPGSKSMGSIHNMPRKSRRNVSEIATTHSDKEELAEGDPDSHPAAGELQVDATMANLQFWCENADTLRKIKGDIKATNNRIDEADIRISETEEKVQGLEEATRELLKLQAKMEEKLTDQVGQARRNNIRIHGIEEGSENNSTSLMVFVENLLKFCLTTMTSGLSVRTVH